MISRWPRWARGLLYGALALCFLELAGCAPSEEAETTAQAGSQEIEVVPVPMPDLENADPAVTEQISQAREHLEALQARPDVEREELANAYGQLGMVYLIYDFLAPAEICFENAAVIMPEVFQWPYLRGYLALIQGELTGAAELLETARELEPAFLPAQLRLGRARLELGELGGAEALFRSTLELEETAAAYEGLGKVASARGETAVAIEYLERAAKLQPEATSLRYAIGQAHRRLGDLNRAQEYLNGAGDVVVRIADPLLKPLGELGRSAQFYLLRAGQALENNDYATAAGAYTRALELDPTDFLAYQGLSYATEQLGDLAGAIAYLEEAVEKGQAEDPERDRSVRGETLMRLGMLESRRGRAAAARGHYARVLELFPSQEQARLGMVNSLARSGQFEEALAMLDVQLAGEGATPRWDLRLRRASILINLGRGEEGLEVFEAALSAIPDDPKVRGRYAEALDLLGREEDAAEQRAILEGQRESTSDPSEAFRHAAELARQGRYEETVDALRKVLAMAPGHLEARFELGSVLGHLGQYEAALVELRKVVESSPRHAAARRSEIIALILTQRWGPARVRLQEALREFPQNRDLAVAQIRLLATAPEDQVRDGDLALEIATRLTEVEYGARTAEALAMAYAEAGQSERAVELQQQLVRDAESAQLPRARVAELAERLRLYESGEAWRAKRPEEILDAAFGSGS